MAQVEVGSGESSEQELWTLEAPKMRRGRRRTAVVVAGVRKDIVQYFRVFPTSQSIKLFSFIASK